MVGSHSSHQMRLDGASQSLGPLQLAVKDPGTLFLAASRSGGGIVPFMFYRHPASVSLRVVLRFVPEKRRSAHDARSPLGRSGAACVCSQTSSLRLPYASVAAPAGERDVRLGDGCASSFHAAFRRVAYLHRASSCGDHSMSRLLTVLTPRLAGHSCRRLATSILSSLRSSPGSHPTVAIGRAS